MLYAIQLHPKQNVSSRNTNSSQFSFLGILTADCPRHAPRTRPEIYLDFLTSDELIWI